MRPKLRNWSHCGARVPPEPTVIEGLFWMVTPQVFCAVRVLCPSLLVRVKVRLCVPTDALVTVAVPGDPLEAHRMVAPRKRSGDAVAVQVGVEGAASTWVLPAPLIDRRLCPSVAQAVAPWLVPWVRRLLQPSEVPTWTPLSGPRKFGRLISDS